LFVGLVCVFVSPLIYLAYPLTTPEHVLLFTWLMRWGGSLATLPLALAVLTALLRYGGATQVEWQARSALQCSLFLFGIGGCIGFLISGSDVTIPAHYHGSIVGVTLAMMGVCYVLLPRLGRPLHNPKLAIWQPIIYSGGQLLHVAGLVWSGGYGVQRKVAGAEQGLDSLERVLGMGLMGLGGLVSSVGGLLFLVIVLRALTRVQQGAHQAECGQ
jgi:heme/copper-type cytochrome/quinol oxidase subunit 1